MHNRHSLKHENITMPWQKILTLEVTHTLQFLLLLFLIIIILRNDGKAAPWQLNVNKLIPKRKDYIVHISPSTLCSSIHILFVFSKDRLCTQTATSEACYRSLLYTTGNIHLALTYYNTYVWDFVNLVVVNEVDVRLKGCSYYSYIEIPYVHFWEYLLE